MLGIQVSANRVIDPIHSVNSRSLVLPLDLGSVARQLINQRVVTDTNYFGCPEIDSYRHLTQATRNVTSDPNFWETGSRMRQTTRYQRESKSLELRQSTKQ